MPLDRDCPVLFTAREFNINTVTVVLAASLFQRVRHALMLGLRPMCITNVLTHSLFHGFAADVHTPHGTFYGGRNPWGLMASALCLHIAVKAVHIPRNTPNRVGHYSLSNLMMYLCGWRLHRDDVLVAETWILEQLDWRVLPLDAPDKDAKRTDASSSPISVCLPLFK